MKQVLYRSEQFVEKKVGDEYILVPIVNGVMDMMEVFTLNEVGTLIISLVDGKKTIEEILDCIVNEFEVDLDIAKSDLFKFISVAKEKGVFV